MQTKLYNIVKLVVPNEQIRSAMLKQQPITKTFFQNKCFDDLLSLFYEKCTVQKNVSITITTYYVNTRVKYRNNMFIFFL